MMNLNLKYAEVFLMGKMGRIILGLGSLAVVTFGICKGISNIEPSKYSLEWIKNLSDKDWATEREIIRQKFCNPKYDEAARLRFENLLRIFDKVKSDRDWAGQTPRGPVYHPEHGTNLYKP